MLGIDLGTSALKAAVFDVQGACIVSGEAALKRFSDCSGERHLHDPRDWWDKAVAVIRPLLASLGQDYHLRAIACCGFHHVPVFLRGDGGPAFPVIMMHDPKLTAFRNKLLEDGRLQTLHERTRSFVSDSHLPPIAEAAHEEFRQEWSSVKYLMLAKDYLRYRLTGNIGTEQCDATGTNLIAAAENNWSEELAAMLDIKPDWLPEIHASTEPAGEVLPEAARELGIRAGVPVYYGGGDSHCALLGLGCLQDGDSAVLLGTNCTLRVVFDEPLYDPQVRLWQQAHVVPERWTLSASSLAGASVVEWSKRILGEDATRGTGPACAEGLFFLPFIHGERCPFYAPDGSGTIVGLQYRHTAGDILSAAKEGVAFVLRNCWQLLQGIVEAKGHGLHSPVISGGGSQDTEWIRLIANVLGQSVERAESSHAGCLGSAMIAATGAGIFPDLHEAARRMGCRRDKISPVAAKTGQFNHYYERFKNLLETYAYTNCKGTYPCKRKLPS
jgi:xylulokinase